MKPLVWTLPLFLAACSLTQSSQQISIDGFAKAPFGASLSALKKAVKKPVYGGSDDASQCQLLFENPNADEKYGMAFLVINNRFERLDVDSKDYKGPGDIVVGESLAEAAKRFSGQATVTSSQSVLGEPQRQVSSPAWGDTRLLMIADSQGLISHWRLGNKTWLIEANPCG
ncbi:hypothetical protein [Gallaecimonas mangrovi]|uniref:hypothetical protein n=1 Tax=Gallaecimonas mangrovi TaxID=2291597 RepID=UPI000E1FD6F8|nr:hypothetical protein [Gallaecimonas mangrovi]